MAPIGAEQPGTDLPAPYRSPWLALGGDLVAVAADLRLRCRELWRRNRSGELPYPKAWPRSLAASFWPLVLVGSVALLGAGLWIGARPGASPAPVPPGVISRAAPRGAGSGLEPPGVDPLAQAKPKLPGEIPGEIQGEALTPAPVPGSPGLQRKAAGDPPGPRASPSSGAPGSPPASGPQALQPPPADGALALDAPPIDPNPRDGWRQRPEAVGFLLQVEGDPGASRIQLRLSDAFGQLQASEQQQRADLWLAWAHDWGYDQLELRDRRGALLGQDARVGGGMILGFSP